MRSRLQQKVLILTFEPVNEEEKYKNIFDAFSATLIYINTCASGSLI